MATDSPPRPVGNVNWGSNIVNGQLVPQAPTSAFWPTYMGSQVRGPGYWPRQGTWQVPPVLPSGQIAAQQSPNAGGSSPVITQSNSGSPWHPTQGTVVFAFLALAIGLFMLHYIHYGKGG